MTDPNSSQNSLPLNKKATMDKTYLKETREHSLLRPDTYTCSVEHLQEVMWIYDTENAVMIQKRINYVPLLYQIFDIILVNAADNKQYDEKMDCIDVTIDSETNTISVWNNGESVPVGMENDETMFGIGLEHFGNIFCTKFTVEIASKGSKCHFKRSWGNDMSQASNSKIKDFIGEDFTKISFTPNLTKFKMEKLDNDIIGLMSRRVFDVAASTCGIKVFLNCRRLPVNNFKDYIDFYIKNKKDSCGNSLKVIYESVSDCCEVALTISESGFKQVSFVNNITTTEGGLYVDCVTNIIVKKLIEDLKEKNEDGVVIKLHEVKNHMWIFVNCLINPAFDLQTEDNMKCQLSDQFITSVCKSDIVEAVLTSAKFKAQTELSTASRQKQINLIGIPKLEDANEAGTTNALKCTLILTERESNKSIAVSGLQVIGRDHYGVFSFNGKPLNVRKTTREQILENAEINNLIKILGLDYKKKYNSEEDMKTLRYGKLMIMTDQNEDGFHTTGLLINFIHRYWPELFRRHFLEEFITPIVKCIKKGEELAFYSLPEFEKWKAGTSNHHSYNVKYYKGLGTLTSKEAKEYFSNMARHRIEFKYTGQQDDDHIILAFSKTDLQQRKQWLANFMLESKWRKEIGIGLPDKYLDYTKETKSVSYTDFVNYKLIHFMNADNVRFLPSLVDGLKPDQRKVLFTCVKRNDKREVKVAQLAGSVADHSAYHHGEVSICQTIVGLAQNYVGSNNLNLLEPRGQFGTRLNGGKDSASPRYIFTKMSSLTRLIFHPEDDPLLKHEYDGNQRIEPRWYIPIIPMVLVNGVYGLGTGWMTTIPHYNPREIVRNLRALLDGEEPTRMIPWYKNFKGTIESCGDGCYVTSGEIAIIADDKVEITELPVLTSTQNYKLQVLEPLLHDSTIAYYKEYNTDTTVKFVITCFPGQLTNLERYGLHEVFKLQNVKIISPMWLFDELGCLRRFESVIDILQEFYTLRLKMYETRSKYLTGMLIAEARKLNNQARFIIEKCTGDFILVNKNRKTILDELMKRKYAPNPVKVWKASQNTDDGADENIQDEEEVDPEMKNFEYLLGMSMEMLTEEKKNELLKQRADKMSKLESMRRKTPSDLWRYDLDTFLSKLQEVEEKETEDELRAEKSTEAYLQETLPSPSSRRVPPVIGDELKKKIRHAIKLKKAKERKE